MKGKRLVTILLVFAMIVVMLPTAAMALTEDGAVETADEFIAAVKSGGTVTLGDNIEVAENNYFSITNQVVLNLNGYSITRDGDSSKPLFTVSNGGSLTVNDQTGNGAINSSYPFHLISNGTFIMNGGKVTSSKGAALDIYNSSSNVKVEINGGLLTTLPNAADNVFGIRGKENVKVDIKGGDIISPEGNRLAMYVSGKKTGAIELNITGGSVQHSSTNIFKSGQAIQAYSGAVINVSGDARIYSGASTAISTQSGYGVVELNVTGGNITTGGSSAYAVYARESSKVNVEGGTISGGTAVCAYDNANVQISGGDITGKSSAIRKGSSGTPIVEVTGGAFNKDVSNYANKDAALAKITSDGATKYVIGDTIAEKAGEAGEGDQIIVTNGSIELTNVPDGVVVSNSGNGEVSVNGEQVNEEPVTAHTHTYGVPVWTWTDTTAAQATFTCTKDETHTATETAVITSAVSKEATCTAKGETTYTAKVTFGEVEYTDQKVAADINIIPHTLEAAAAKEPTCTEEGNDAYWYCKVCDKYFADKDAVKEITLDETVIPKTAHTYKDGVCTVCGAADPDYEEFVPEIIKGANATWQKGDEGLSFTSNAEFADFIKVQVDGKDLNAANYTVKEGSTIVTLKASYLDTLEAGEHKLAIVSKTGTAETKFTVEKEAGSDTPKTDDSANMMMWLALMMLAGAGAIGTKVYSRKFK